MNHEPRSIAAAGPATARRRGFRTKLFYGIGCIPYGVKDNGFSVLLLLFYNQVLGLDVRLAGLAIMIALVLDALVDPIIGYVSDNLRTRLGRRHPFMYAAAIPVSLSYLFLFSPPLGLSQGELFTYLLVVAISVRFFISIYEIPNAALIAELTDCYEERTSYMSFRFFFGWIGGLTMLMLAYTVFLKGTPEQPVGQLNIAGYGRYGVAAAVVMFIGIIVSSIGTQSAVDPNKFMPRRTATSVGGIVREIVAVISQRAALTMLIAGMLVALSTGLTFALNYYFHTYFWELRPRQVSVLVAGSFVAAGVALIVTPILARRLEKRAAAIGAVLMVITIVPMPYLGRLLGIMPVNGAPALVPTLLVYQVINTTFVIMWTILLASMLTDVVEDNEVRTGRRSEGVLFAANTFVAKCVSGLGIFLSAAILALVSFPDSAVPGEVLPETLWDLAFTYLGAILLLNLAAAGCVVTYKITRSVHQQNLETLAAQALENSGQLPGSLPK